MFQVSSTTCVLNRVLLLVFSRWYNLYIYRVSEKLYIADGKIDTSPEAISYWADEFRCSDKDLLDAVGRIGNGYTILLLYLEMNRLIKDE